MTTERFSLVEWISRCNHYLDDVSYLSLRFLHSLIIPSYRFWFESPSWLESKIVMSCVVNSCIARSIHRSLFSESFNSSVLELNFWKSNSISKNDRFPGRKTGRVPPWPSLTPSCRGSASLDLRKTDCKSRISLMSAFMILLENPVADFFLRGIDMRFAGCLQ